MVFSVDFKKKARKTACLTLEFNLQHYRNQKLEQNVVYIAARLISQTSTRSGLQCK